MSVWPVEGGRYGVDGTYQGATGFERAEAAIEAFLGPPGSRSG